MGLYRPLWGIILVLSSLLATISIASAETRERNLLLDSNSNQSFETLIQQAQDLAKDSIEQEFAENSEVTEVSILVLGERNGSIVPLLRSRVSRSEWQRDPRIYRWTRAFSTSGMLLGFNNSAASPSSTPTEISRPAKFLLEDDPGFRDD
jgi:hypothetical protein